jgi:hypothetical protein
VVIDQRVNQSVAVSASTEHTFSFFAKKGTTTTPRYSVYDLSNNAFILTQVDYSSLVNTSTWSRITATFTTPAGCTLVSIYPINAASLGTTFIWGCQLETGVATDYIATTTAAVSVGPVSGLPRLDYLGSTCPRLILEPQRSNVLTFSEQLDNAAWGNAAAVTANSVVSPDGYTNADTVTGNLSELVSYTSGTAYTFSVFAKKNSGSTLSLRVDATAIQTCTFNLDTIVAGSGGTMTNYGNGWYRCAFTFTANATATGVAYILPPTSVYLYGCQLETGAYATSYIPTLGASVTRVADAATTASVPSLIGQTEGTMFIEFNRTNTFEAAFFMLSNLVGTTTNAYQNSFYFLQQANGTMVVEVYVASAAQVLFTVAALSVGTHKMALAYKANDFALYVDGVQLGTDTSGSVPTANFLSIGGAVDGGAQKQSVSQALLFKTRLTNAQLAELTA